MENMEARGESADKLTSANRLSVDVFAHDNAPRLLNLRLAPHAWQRVGSGCCGAGDGGRDLAAEMRRHRI